MLALRKTSIPMPASSDMGSPDLRPGRYGPQPAGDHTAIVSPALALRDHLSARLEEMAQAGIGGAAALSEPTSKLPMAVRVATIVGLSATLWLALGLGIAAII